MRDLPALVFAMRYPNAIGFVHNSMGRIYDRIAQLLNGDFSCFIAYPELCDAPKFEPIRLQRLEADFYDATGINLAKVRAVISKHQIQVIVFMDGTHISPRFLRRLGVNTIEYVQYSFPSNLRQSLIKKLVKRLVRCQIKWNLHDVYLSNGKHQRDFLLTYAQIPESRVFTITNGVDVTYFCPGEPPVASELRIPVTQYYALTVCQSRPEKRVDILIDAAAEIFKRRPDLPIAFLYVGSGQCLEVWQRKAEVLGLQQRFCFLGYRNDVLPYLRRCSFYLHAAERESISFAIAEAMACGKPVICADALGPRELVEHGITGLLIQQGKVDAFADAILAMLDDPATIQRMGHAARERAVTWFSLERQANEFATLVRQRFGGQRRSTGICRTASV